MEPFKNLFNKEVVARIGRALKKQWPLFNYASFIKNSERELLPLELKERVAFITARLKSHLPDDPNVSIALLVATLKQVDKNDEGLEHFAVWPLTHYVALYGLEHFDLSLNALLQMTKVFTSEFAVRPFFVKDELRTLKFMKACARHENEHVRRWASEGSRPLLPWGQKLHSFVSNPNASWEILEQLKNDPSEYVRKSVANHLNDHSKNHPDFVIEKLMIWHRQKDKTAQLEWVIKHASRSLIKKGHKKAFLFHGVESAKIKMHHQKILTKKIKLGEVLKVEVTLENLSKKSAKIILDHELHLLKANGSHGIKVFKGKKISLEAGEKSKVEMTIPLKAVSTRVYYSGKQYWNIKINGESAPPLTFDLVVLKAK